MTRLMWYGNEDMDSWAG